MHLDCDGGVVAGDVLADEFSSDFSAFGTAERDGIVVCDGFEVAVAAGRDFEVAGSGVAEERAVFQDVNVNVRNGGRVVRRVGYVDGRADGQRRLRRVQDTKVDEFGVEGISDVAQSGRRGRFARFLVWRTRIRS